jgi:hypothetical protein
MQAPDEADAAGAISVPKKHECLVPDCGYTTNDKSNYNKHQKRHVASDEALIRNDIQQHIVTEKPGVHSERGTKRKIQACEDADAAGVVSVPNNHVCSVLDCGYSTNDKSNFNKHKKQHTASDDCYACVLGSQLWL